MQTKREWEKRREKETGRIVNKGVVRMTEKYLVPNQR